MSAAKREQTAEEKAEIELGEAARVAADDWTGGVAPGKATRFWPSFTRLIGLLRPNALAFVGVSILGAAGVVLSVLAPKVLGNATNVLFEGVVSSMAPAGTTKQQVVDQLMASGQHDLANIVKAMQHFVPGAGVGTLTRCRTPLPLTGASFGNRSASTRISCSRPFFGASSHASRSSIACSAVA